MKEISREERLLKLDSLRGRTLYLNIPEGVLHREEFECAAWYKIHALKPGNYGFVIRDEDIKEAYAAPREDKIRTVVQLDTTVIEQDLRSRWGGVALNPPATFQPYNSSVRILVHVDPFNIPDCYTVKPGLVNAIR